MLSGVFELQVHRGTAFHEVEYMPRVVKSRIPIARPALEAWRLRCNYQLEEHIAALGKRRLHLIEEDTVEAGRPDEQTRRRVRCELIGEHLGGTMMGAVTSKDLVSEITSTFYAHRFDEDHGASFVVDMVKVAINVAIAGHQWCEPDGEANCYLHTRIELSVRVVGVGTLIEMQLERQMRASHAAFPKHADEYVQRNAEARARAAGRASPPSSPELDVDLAKLPANGPTLEELPGPVARAAAAPRLSRWRLAWSLVAWRMRRHDVLSENAARTVTVRVGVRHARLLLLCGCASVMDADEIVE